MPSLKPLFPALSLLAHLREWRGFATPRNNALLPQILAFWALWHCRHARPPDALRVAL